MSSKDVSKDMGQLLLKGWTMLAENCPPCQVPLMRDPKSKDRLCVNCKKSYKANEPLPDVDSDFSDVEESQDKDEAPKIAEASGSMSGVAATSASAAEDKDKERAKRAEQSERCASLLSTKMLQGWILLDSLCPQCDTVLVRNKKTQIMFCVCCDARIMTEAEAIAQNATLSHKPPPAPPRAPKPAPSPKAPPANVAVPMPAGANKPRAGAAAGSHPLPPGAILAVQGNTLGGTGTSLPPLVATGATFGQDASVVFEAAAQAVLRKTTAVTRLFNTTPAKDPETCLKHLELMRECADTWKKLSAEFGR